MKISALEWMMKEFPDIKERDEMRKIIGRYGLTGQQQVTIVIFDTILFPEISCCHHHMRTPPSPPRFWDFRIWRWI